MAGDVVHHLLRRTTGRRGALPEQRTGAAAESVALQPNPTQVAHLVDRHDPCDATGALTEVHALQRAGWSVSSFALSAACSASETTMLRDDASQALLSTALRAARPTELVATLRSLARSSNRLTASSRLWLDAAALLAHLDAAEVGHIHAHLSQTPSAQEALVVARRTVDLDRRRQNPRGITWSVTLADPHLRGVRDGWSRMGRRLQGTRGVAVTGPLPAGLGRIGAPVRQVTPGVDVAGFQPSPVAYRPSPQSGQPFRLLTVGQVTYDSRIEHILQVLQQVPRTHLSVVGDGPHRSRLKLQAARLGLSSRITWFPQVERTDLQAIYRSADAFVLPAALGSVPAGVLQAMACGLPVVAPDAPALTDVVIDGQTGVLAGSGQIRDLAPAVTALAQDAHRLVAMGIQARRRVEEHFTLDQHGQQLADFLAEVSGSESPAVVERPHLLHLPRERVAAG